jgi:hypothetical protein
MEDDYREDDRLEEDRTGSWAVVDYCHKNILKQAARGFLFGLGHYIAYRLVGGYLSRRIPAFN